MWARITLAVSLSLSPPSFPKSPNITLTHPSPPSLSLSLFCELLPPSTHPPPPLPPPPARSGSAFVAAKFAFATAKSASGYRRYVRQRRCLRLWPPQLSPPPPLAAAAFAASSSIGFRLRLHRCQIRLKVGRYLNMDMASCQNIWMAFQTPHSIVEG
ncbi:uncharacterized protein LOC127811123 [Diospyros lotus]|uniref:uncharacterized protein LOC127811123 n=1 Tax=Diospyros lotus TaxID=55363 RepID=UPI002254F749|nr:uncharacterized protein LOC127811123 [Diospyros lotus]